MRAVVLLLVALSMEGSFPPVAASDFRHIGMSMADKIPNTRGQAQGDAAAGQPPVQAANQQELSEDALVDAKVHEVFKDVPSFFNAVTPNVIKESLARMGVGTGWNALATEADRQRAQAERFVRRTPIGAELVDGVSVAPAPPLQQQQQQQQLPPFPTRMDLSRSTPPAGPTSALVPVPLPMGGANSLALAPSAQQAEGAPPAVGIRQQVVQSLPPSAPPSAVEQAIAVLAKQRLVQFAPTTEQGRLTLERLVNGLGKLPGVESAGRSMATNPALMVNMLDSMRGTFALRALYQTLGGEAEVESHQVLLEAGGNGASSAALAKSAAFFSLANLMLFVLLMSELYEYLHFEVYRPGQKTPGPIAESPYTLYRPEPEPEGSHEDDSEVAKTYLAIRAKLLPYKDTVVRPLLMAAENCHDFVTFGREGLDRPYMKVTYVLIIFMMTWSAQMVMFWAVLFSLSDAVKVVQEKVRGVRDSIPRK